MRFAFRLPIRRANTTGEQERHDRRTQEESGEIAMELSARNQFPGTVKDVKLGGVMAEVTVELAGGQQVVSAITRGSAENLNLQVGDQVTVVIKSTEVMLGK
jgi:molybdopterin-binding protein